MKKIARKVESIKEKKGITLIALVITIVVLIILAGVVISLSLGNNGLFNKAQEAKEKYTNAQDDEKIEIAKTVNNIDDFVNYSRTGEIQNSFSSKINYSTTTESVIGTWIDGSNIYGKVIDMGYNYDINITSSLISSSLLPADISTPIKACFYIIDTNNYTKGTNPCEFNRTGNTFECRPIVAGMDLKQDMFIYI